MAGDLWVRVYDLGVLTSQLTVQEQKKLLKIGNELLGPQVYKVYSQSTDDLNETE